MNYNLGGKVLWVEGWEGFLIDVESNLVKKNQQCGNLKCTDILKEFQITRNYSCLTE